MNKNNEQINPLPALNVKALDFESTKFIAKAALWFFIVTTLVVDLFWLLLERVQFNIQYFILIFLNSLLIFNIVWYFILLKKLTKQPAKCFIYSGLALLAMVLELILLCVFFNFKNSIELNILHYVLIALGVFVNLALLIRKHWIYKVGRFRPNKTNNNYGNAAIAVVVVGALLPLVKNLSILKSNSDLVMSLCFLMLAFCFLIISAFALHNYYIARKENIGI